MFHVKHSASTTGVLEFLSKVNPARDWARSREPLEKYVELLLQHAARRNLLSASQQNPQAIWSHIFDSVQPLALEIFNGTRTLIDAGSGGGLPGVPLAIVCPDCKVLLVERSNTKAEFLELVRAVVPLPNAAVCAAELKSVLCKQPEGSIVLARALTQPSKWRALLDKSSMNSTWIIFATEHNHNEWAVAASEMSLRLAATHEYSPPDSSAKRILLQFS